MRAADHPGGTDPLAQALSGYRPRGAAETADFERVHGLLAADDPWARSAPLHVTASALILHPPTHRVLLRWHARQHAWLQVGGHGDPGERDPLAVALREGREETGLGDLALWPGSGVVHLVVVPVAERGDEPAHEHADLRYVLSTGTPEAIRPENPASPLRWLTMDQAYEATYEPNVHETLSRAWRLLAGPEQPPVHSSIRVK